MRRLFFIAALAGAIPILPSAAHASDVFYVGDSLGPATTRVMVPYLGGFSVRVSNAAGRTSAGGVSVLRSGLRGDDQVVVLDVGSADDPAQASALAANLGKAGKLAAWRCMVVVTTTRPGADALNAAIESFAGGRKKTELADWKAAAKPKLLGSDGVSLKPAGAQERGRVVAEAAQACIDKYAGTAPGADDDDSSAGDDAGSHSDPGGDVAPGDIPADEEEDFPDSDLPPASRGRSSAGAGASQSEPLLLPPLVRRIAASDVAGWVRSGTGMIAGALSAVGFARGQDVVLGSD